MVALSDSSYEIKGWQGCLFTIALTVLALFFNTTLFRKFPLIQGIFVVSRTTIMLHATLHEAEADFDVLHLVAPHPWIPRRCDHSMGNRTARWRGDRHYILEQWMV